MYRDVWLICFDGIHFKEFIFADKCKCKVMNTRGWLKENVICCSDVIFTFFFLFLFIECPSNLILKTCANTCPPTCGSIFGKAPCSLGAGCIRGCFCPDGMVKESESSERCVRPSQCPSSRPPCTKCAGKLDSFA